MAQRADIAKVNESAVSKICSDLQSAEISHVLLVGYSRGAVSALTVADRVNKECSVKNKVKWIGLLDVVETSIWNFGRLERDKNTHRSIPDGVEALHVHKDPRQTAGTLIDLFITSQLRIEKNSGAVLTEYPIPNIKHGDIGRGIVDGVKRIGEQFDGYKQLKEGAEKHGATFLPLTSL